MEVGKMFIKTVDTRNVFIHNTKHTQTEETNMATLDIRTGTNLTIDEILFQKSSESNSLSSIKQSPNKYTKSVFFKNCKGDLVGFVDMDDIDNLILALQKAKELWSK